MIKLRILRKHIYRDRNQPDPLTAVLNEAGYPYVHIEGYCNLIPPNHKFGVWIAGTRYAMSHRLRNYYEDWAIEEGDRTKYAELLIDTDQKTADIRIPVRTKDAPYWVRHGITEKACREADERRATEDRRNGFILLSHPAALQAEIDSLPDGHWLKAKDISKWMPAQIHAHFNQRGKKQ